MAEIGFVWNYSGFWQDSLRRHLCAHAILAPSGRRSEADIFGAPFWQAIFVGQGAGRGRDAKSIQLSHSLRVFSS